LGGLWFIIFYFFFIFKNGCGFSVVWGGLLLWGGGGGLNPTNPPLSTPLTVTMFLDASVDTILSGLWK